LNDIQVLMALNTNRFDPWY